MAPDLPVRGELVEGAESVTLTAWIQGVFHFLHFVTLAVTRVTKWRLARVTSRVTKGVRDWGVNRSPERRGRRRREQVQATATPGERRVGAMQAQDEGCRTAISTERS